MMLTSGIMLWEAARLFANYQIGVFRNAVFDAVPEGEQHDLSPFAPGKFHGWDKIAVARYQGDDIDMLFQGQASHVQADPHVDTLLFDVRFEASGIIEGDGELFGFVGRNAVLPTSHAELSEAKGEEGDLRKVLVQGFVHLGQGRFTEIFLATVRSADLVLQRNCIIEVDTVQELILEVGVATDICDQVVELLGIYWRISSIPELVFDEARIEENGKRSLHKGTLIILAIKRPPSGSGPKPRLYRHPQSSRFLWRSVRTHFNECKRKAATFEQICTTSWQIGAASWQKWPVNCHETYKFARNCMKIKGCRPYRGLYA